MQMHALFFKCSRVPGEFQVFTCQCIDKCTYAHCIVKSAAATPNMGVTEALNTHQHFDDVLGRVVPLWHG